MSDTKIVSYVDLEGNEIFMALPVHSVACPQCSGKGCAECGNKGKKRVLDEESFTVEQHAFLDTIVNNANSSDRELTFESIAPN